MEVTGRGPQVLPTELRSGKMMSTMRTALRRSTVRIVVWVFLASTLAPVLGTAAPVRWVSSLVSAPSAPGPTTPVAVAPAPVMSSAAADDGARVIAEQMIDSRTLDLTVSTPALTEPAKVRLLLPTGWSRDASRTWPVLYLLHGCCALAGRSYTAWTKYTDVEELTAKADVIVVMPEAGRQAMYSDYWDFGRGGPPQWEQFHIAELPQILERGYRTGPQRAIAGLSSGALGALGYAQRHPGMFRAVASYSGLNCTGQIRAPMVIQFIALVAGQNPDTLWGNPLWQAGIWRLYDPCQHVERLRGTLVYLSAGNGLPITTGVTESDMTMPIRVASHILEFETGVNARMLAGRLHAGGVDVITHFYTGGAHSWPYWQCELHWSFPILMRALDVPITGAPRDSDALARDGCPAIDQPG